MPTLGTNPISVVAPATGDDYYALDMATTPVALGKVRIVMSEPASLELSSSGFYS